MSGSSKVPPPEYGVTGWPFDAAPACPARPALLPDGQPWPRIRVLVPDGASPGTLASIAHQNYPEHFVETGSSETLSSAREALLLLRDGDMLAPGALIALALELALSGASAVAVAALL